MGFRLYLCGDLDGYRMRFFSGHAMSKNWIAVASAEHVRLGRSNGFMQVSHGKSAPLRRIERPSRILFADRRVPRQRQAAILHGNRCRERGRSISSRHGRRILPVPSGCHLANGRGDTDSDASRAAGVHERQQELGYQLRSGLAEISELDMLRIARAMGASLT